MKRALALFAVLAAFATISTASASATTFSCPFNYQGNWTTNFNNDPHIRVGTGISSYCSGPGSGAVDVQISGKWNTQGWTSGVYTTGGAGGVIFGAWVPEQVNRLWFEGYYHDPAQAFWVTPSGGCSGQGTHTVTCIRGANIDTSAYQGAFGLVQGA